MPTKLTLKCLGVPRLSSASGREIPFKAKKHLALLVYLAVEDKARHRREHLVEQFWPGVSTRLGRQSLATALSAIRRRLGDPEAVEGSADYVRLRAGTVSLDLDHLLAGRVVGEDWVPIIEVAGFLEGFDLPDLPDFHHWQDRQQARLLPAILRGLVALTDLARRSGDVGQLGKLADRLLTINELSEEGVRARMEAAAMSGDRITALRSYEQYEQRLQIELNARPAVALERMATRLRRRGWERPLDSPEPSVRTEQWQDRAFVGRAWEYRALYELWERARDGRAGHMLILGESGVGKTTLADRFATAVSLEGAQVARSRGYELERGIPFAMIGAMLRALLDRPGVAAASPASLAELARIVPEFGSRFPNLPPVPEALGESARIRFAEALLELVLALTAEQPLVLVVDDFHQVDDASLAALHFVMRRVSQHPLIILLTSRVNHPEDTPTAVRIRENASQLALGTLELGPMTLEESGALLDALIALAPRPPTTVERKALLRAGGGFPLAIELLFSAWQDHGHDLSFLSLDTMTVAVGRGPEGAYSRLAESSLRQLGPNQLMVLHLAAILDRRLGELGMYRLVDLTPTQAVAEMMVLSARRVLRDVGQRLEFVNPAIRAHAYLSIPGTLRTVLHSGVADDLLARRAKGERILGLELAWHCIRADRVEEGRPYILSGAREALDQGAPHEVELALKTGMDLLEGEQKTTATLLLAEAVGEVGRWEEALEILSDQMAQASPDQLTEFEALALLARMRLYTPNATATEELLRSAAHMAATAPTTQARLHAATAGALACLELRDSVASARLRDILEPLNASDLDGPARSHLLMSLATLNAHEGRNEAALVLVTQASRITTAHGMRSALRARIENGVGAALCAVGRYEEAIPHFQDAIKTWQTLGNETTLRTPANNLALCHWRLGNYEAQKRAVEQTLDLPDSGRPTADVFFSLYQAALAAAFLGKSDQAQSHVDAIRSLFGSSTIGWLRQRALLSVADILWLLNQRSRAKNVASSALSGELRKPLATQTAGAYCRWLAVLAGSQNEKASVARQIESHRDNLALYDSVDQLEVLMALAMLRPLEEEEQQLLATLSFVLPENIVLQLQMLGLSQTN